VEEVETGKTEFWPPKERFLHGDTIGYKPILEQYLFHTSAMMIRNSVLKRLPKAANQAGVGDIIMQIYPLQFGPWTFCEGIMSTFRRFPHSNFYHWDPRLLISTLAIAEEIESGKNEKKLIKQKLSEELFKTSIWRRSYNDPKEARSFFLRAIIINPIHLNKKVGIFKIAKQGLATLFNLGKKHSFAGVGKFKAKA